MSAALRPGGAFAKPISPHKEEAPEHHILRLGLRLLLALAARLDRLDSDKAPDVEDEQWAAQRGSGVVKGE